MTPGTFLEKKTSKFQLKQTYLFSREDLAEKQVDHTSGKKKSIFTKPTKNQNAFDLPDPLFEMKHAQNCNSFKSRYF